MANSGSIGAIRMGNLPVAAEENRILHFSVFEVDLKTGELRRNGTKIRLQEQPFQILSVFLERPGDVVTREELRSRLWPADTFVDFDHSLNTAIRRLRDALGDTAENPRFVETVARRGYRFLAPVNGNGPSVQVPPLSEPAPLRPNWWIVAIALAAVLGVGVTVGRRMAQPATAPPLSLTERRLTANSSELPVTDGIISPDGKYLAFADPSGVYLRQVDTGETHPLAFPAGFDAKPAAWFPDGTHLLATHADDPRQPASIWEISLLGGSPRKLINQGLHPQVSPDGSQIVYLVVNPDIQEIWICAANGESAHKIADTGGISLFGPPVWSPDGQGIGYMHGQYSHDTTWIKSQLEVFNLRLARPNIVLSATDLYETIGWAPDGRLIYAQAEPIPNTGDSNLWALHVDSLGHASGSPVRLTHQAGSASFPSVTADGKRLAYFRRTVEPDVYVTDVLDHSARLSPPHRLTQDDRSDLPYAWTADNHSVIFLSDRNGPSNIFRQDIDKTEPDLLVRSAEELQIPRLSPDSRSVIYLVKPRLGEHTTPVRLMRVPLEGGLPQTIATLPGTSNHQCARLPSTTCLLSVIEDGKERFFQFDPDKGIESELPQLEVRSANPYEFNWSLSPDGRWLAMSKKQAQQPNPSVRLLSLAGDPERSIPILGWSGVGYVDWAADGNSLWVGAHTNAGVQALLNVSLNGKVRPMLQQSKLFLGWAIPSPDGKHLALWKAEGASNISMLENF